MKAIQTYRTHPVYSSRNEDIIKMIEEELAKKLILIIV